MMNDIPKLSRESSLWKAIKRYLLPSGLAICGLISLAALVLPKQRKSYVDVDEDVEDFTSDQRAMLQRVREIWDELPADQKTPAPASRAAITG